MLSTIDRILHHAGKGLVASELAIPGESRRCQVRDSAIRRELVRDAIDRADGLSIIFRKCDHRQSGRNRIAIGNRVSDLDAARAGLVAVGAMLLRDSHIAGTWRVATMSDPAGNLFELIEE
jgi:Glyoxalase-like domain